MKHVIKLSLFLSAIAIITGVMFSESDAQPINGWVCSYSHDGVILYEEESPGFNGKCPPAPVSGFHNHYVESTNGFGKQAMKSHEDVVVIRVPAQ